MERHRWREQDDLKVFFVYKFGIENAPLIRKEIAKEIGVSLGSFAYRVANFKAIDGIGTATHIAKLSREVQRKYSNLSELELKEIAFKHVSTKSKK